MCWRKGTIAHRSSYRSRIPKTTWLAARSCTTSLNVFSPRSVRVISINAYMSFRPRCCHFSRSGRPQNSAPTPPRPQHQCLQHSLAEQHYQRFSLSNLYLLMNNPLDLTFRVMQDSQMELHLCQVMSQFPPYLLHKIKVLIEDQDLLLSYSQCKSFRNPTVIPIEPLILSPPIRRPMVKLGLFL